MHEVNVLFPEDIVASWKDLEEFAHKFDQMLAEACAVGERHLQYLEVTTCLANVSGFSSDF